MEEIYIKISMKGQGQSPVSPGKREFKFGRMTKCSFLYTWFLQMQSILISVTYKANVTTLLVSRPPVFTFHVDGQSLFIIQYFVIWGCIFLELNS